MSYETEEYNIYDPSFSTSSVDELCSIFSSGASSIENNCEHVKSITEDTRKNFERIPIQPILEEGDHPNKASIDSELLKSKIYAQ